MAIEDLLAALESEAAREREALLAEARAEVERLRADAADRAARRRREIVGPRERALREQAEVALVEGRRQARAEVLEARRRLVERVLATLTARLNDVVSGPGYRSVLPTHVEEALAFAGDEPCAIRCPPAIAAVVRDVVASRPGVAVVEDPGAPPGITLEARDGALLVDNTLAGRLERLAPRIALEVARRAGVGP
jgi:vacuolar-type H+-ATPase subunit E/Vma4